MGQNRNRPVLALFFAKEKSPKTAVLSHSWGFVCKRLPKRYRFKLKNAKWYRFPAILQCRKKPSTIGAAAGDRGLSLFDVFLLDGDAAFAVDLDSGVVYDDLFDQCLHDHGMMNRF